MASSAGKHVVLTGTPGIGKTTLVQKTCKALQDQKVPVFGFYTEEIRDANTRQRTGFQVITIDGKMGTLASVTSKSTKRVGSYGVEVSDFESTALPSMDLDNVNSGVLVLDEIGKMEMFSDKFKVAVDKAFMTPGIKILTTIPIAKGKPIEFVEKIRHHPDAKLFVVDKTNRNQLLSQIISAITGNELKGAGI